MKRAFMSETAIMRSFLPSIAGVGLFIFVVLTLANATDGDSGMSAGTCAVSAMSPIMIMSSLLATITKTAGSAIEQRYPSRAKTSSVHVTCALLPSQPSWHARLRF